MSEMNAERVRGIEAQLRDRKYGHQGLPTPMALQLIAALKESVGLAREVEEFSCGTCLVTDNILRRVKRMLARYEGLET